MLALRNFSWVVVFSMLTFGSTSQVFAEEFDAAATYAKTCAVCHNSGVAGAPRKGDSAAWASRMAAGEEAMLNSVKNGKGAMPAKGLCTDCTDEQLKALIQYLAK